MRLVASRSVSILYLRCLTYVAVDVYTNNRNGFNSLFEMPPEWVVWLVCAVEVDVSILYLRCAIGIGCAKRPQAVSRFQFSI